MTIAETIMWLSKVYDEYLEDYGEYTMPEITQETMAIGEALDVLRKVEAAKQEKNEWIDTGYHVMCSNCGEKFDDAYDVKKKNWKRCPYCEARMEVKND